MNISKLKSQTETKLNHFRKNSFARILDEQDYRQILSSLQPDEKFTDPIFPPESSSIFSGLTQFSEKNKNRYHWVRLSDFPDYRKFNILKEPKGIKYDADVITEDVIQGDLGDCYFLSAISAIAEYPDRIRNLFEDCMINDKGIFQVKVYLHGMPRFIVIDDWFPCHKSDNDSLKQLAFCNINDKTLNIWPILLEKVWAKLNLNYENIIAGNCAEAFEFLSPAPFETYFHDLQQDSLFQRIKEFDEKKYLICCDITDTGNFNLYNLQEAGLITNHAYTVIDSAEVNDYSGDVIKLLKVRNPWGSHEWTGDWSDKSDKWTPQLKKQLSWNDEEDGTFWISYQDFCRFYTTTHVCMLHDNYHFSTRKFEYDFHEPHNFVRVTLNRKTSGFFIVNQKNARIYKNAKGLKDFANLYIAVNVFKAESNGAYTAIGSACGTKNRLYIRGENLDKGTYYISVSFPRRNERILDFEPDGQSDGKMPYKPKTAKVTYVVGMYCSIERLEIEEEEEHSKVQESLRGFIADLGRKNDNKYYFTEEGEKNAYRSISYEKDKGAYGFIYYSNQSEAYIHEKFAVNDLQGVSIIPLLEDCNGAYLDGIGKDCEDIQERKNINSLKEKADLRSEFKVLSPSNPSEVLSLGNLLEFQVKVAPFSSCMLLLQKYSEDTSIEFVSEVALTYPLYSLVNERKFNAKKSRVKYKKEEVEIYETIIEHNSGIVFKFKNRTKDLKFGVFLRFNNMNNLTIHNPETFKEELDGRKTSKSRLADKNMALIDNFQEADDFGRSLLKDPSTEISIVLDPGTSQFFELSTEDIFKEFSYSCHATYFLNLNRLVSG